MKPESTKRFGGDSFKKGKKMAFLEPAFLRHLKLTLSTLRFSGLFPMTQTVLHLKNLPNIIIIAFLGGMSGYNLLFKTIPAFASMFAKWNVQATVAFGIGLYFALSFACLVFVVSLGYSDKLERFSKLLSEATDQSGLELRFTRMTKTLYTIQIVLMFAAFLNFIIYISLWAIPSIAYAMPVAVNTLVNLFGESWLGRGSTLIFAPLDYFVLYQSALLYWTSCKCLRIEFEQISEDISNCDLSNARQLKVLALKHCRLLKCLNCLHDMVALYVMSVFALGSLISTLFAYVMLLDVDIGYRLLGAYWVFLTACVNCILCLSAEGLHNAAKEAKERVCFKIAEGGKDVDVDNTTYNIAMMICQQSTVDSGITAFGFFTVSKEMLLTIYSFIATYVVILLQTPPPSGDFNMAFKNVTVQ